MQGAQGITAQGLEKEMFNNLVSYGIQCFIKVQSLTRIEIQF